ncbi:MAG: cyclophilin-like fold protein [Lachnospiraceae bacterium]|nr:cyclophilin-like fold protein [Lachnospiraceae bacterium]
MKRKMTAVFAVCGLLIIGLLSACGRQDEAPAAPPREVIEDSADSDVPVGADVQESAAGTADSEAESGNSMPGMTMQFGYDGPIYDVVLEDNDTAATLADYAARGEYNLPIYTYENYENEDILQFYDIPSRYEIPDDAQHYTEEKAGELYYSYPNRVILFYQDAQVEADYTKIGTLTSTEGLVDAVQNNEPLADWNCLVIPVRVVQ